MKASIDLKNNSISFEVSTKIYSKDIIYKACYVFIDRMYVLLDIPNKKDVILVTLKGKASLVKKDLEKMEGEFMNELLNSLVRENISKRNQKVLEQIVGGAMGAALGAGNMQNDDKLKSDGCNDNCDDNIESKEIEDAVAALRKELEAFEIGDDYESDALGIRDVQKSDVGNKKNKEKKNEKKK
ncbi:MAG: His-Xaa-Ser system protein HxsD [Candidatus Moranbacteria bacterium]|nr:His-Xaa-Ser system protein HxsD [Candidatus Moranbacteria bacterium]